MADKQLNVDIENHFSAESGIEPVSISIATKMMCVFVPANHEKKHAWLQSPRLDEFPISQGSGIKQAIPASMSLDIIIITYDHATLSSPRTRDQATCK